MLHGEVLVNGLYLVSDARRSLSKAGERHISMRLFYGHQPPFLLVLGHRLQPRGLFLLANGRDIWPEGREVVKVFEEFRLPQDIDLDLGLSLECVLTQPGLLLAKERVVVDKVLLTDYADASFDPLPCVSNALLQDLHIPLANHYEGVLLLPLLYEQSRFAVLIEYELPDKRFDSVA